MAEETMEEIIVTGSYIKRDSFDSASPLTVIDSNALMANATPNLGEVLVNQTFNYGSDYQTNTYAARGQGGNTTDANLRGLGANATLQLIDGKRTVYTNLNNKMPQIAIDRIDILRDGAAATYGSDAVAGVVNIIPRKSFSGIEMSAFRSQADDLDENAYEFLMGADTDSGHITMAGAFRTRGQLQQTERPKFLRRGFDTSGTGNPGAWNVPDRDPVTGALDGTVSRKMDPGCGAFDGAGGTDAGSKFNTRSGIPNSSGTNCSLHFGEWWNYMNPNVQWSVWTNFQYELTDQLDNEMDVLVTTINTKSRGSAQNPGGRTEEFPIVLGTHPGNPYRAFADANANGLIDAGEQLFALDADLDGVPDRAPGVDLNGDGVDDVILSATPFVGTPGTTSIAFNEDVDVVALRAFGKLGTRATKINDDYSNQGNSTFDTTTVRVWDALTYTVPDSSWEITGSGMYEVQNTKTSEKNTSQRALEEGLQGVLKATPTDSTTSFWNPFATQELECVDRVCSNTGTPTFANTQDVMGAVNISAIDQFYIEALQVELLGTGDLVEIPTGGMLEGAFGITYRRVEQDVDLNAPNNACDWHEGGCNFDWVAEQDYVGLFYEFFVPVIDDLDISIAGGYVDYGGEIGNSFDPKFAVMYRPLDFLSLRGSWSSAFIAPTLTQQFSPEVCGLQTANDPLTKDTSNSFRVACVSGNPELTPETANVWNVGASASFELLDGDVNLGVDYAVYDFDDRITQETMNNVLSRDFDAFLAAGGDVDDPVSVQSWIDNNQDPNIIRDVTNVLTRVQTSRLNAQQMKQKAWDFYGRYTRSFDTFGTFTWGLSATYVDEYSFDLGLGIPKGDGAGKQNENIIAVPPMPRWRVNGTINWLYGNSTAVVRVRRISEFDMGFNSAGLQGGQAFFNGTLVFDPATYIDLQYGYQFTDVLGTGREAQLEVGVRNLTDYFPDPIFNLGGIETFVHDIRGRIFYGRINVNL